MVALPKTVDNAFSQLDGINRKSFFHKPADVIGLKSDNRTVRWMRNVQSGTAQLFAYAGSTIAFFPCLAIGAGAEFCTFSRVSKIAILASATAIGLLCWKLASNNSRSEEENRPVTARTSHAFSGNNVINVGNNLNFGNTLSTDTSTRDAGTHAPESEFGRVFNKSLAISALASGIVGASVGSVVSLVIVPPISGTVNAFEYMIDSLITEAA